MENIDKNGRVKLTLRIKKQYNAMLKAVALKENRSVTNEVEHMISTYAALYHKIKVQES